MLILLAAWLCCAAPPARALPMASNDDPQYWYVDIRKPFFAPRRLPDGRVVLEPQRARSRARPFLKDKAPGALRVFVIGGSVAMQFDSEPALSRGWTFAKILERAFPGRRAEVIHCGMGAYDSYRESLILDEVLGYSPDLIVLMSGNNESSSAAGPPPPSARALLRLRGLLRLGSTGAGAAAPRDYVGDFAKNVAGMARKSRRAGVPLVLCTMPRQLGLPPKEALPLSTPAFLAAWLQWEEGGFSAAEAGFRLYEKAAAKDPFGPLWLGRCLERRADADGARRAYRRALALQGERIPQINAAIRAAAAREGALVADLEEVFGRADGGVRGERLIYDAMHWNRFVDPLVGVAIARAARAAVAGSDAAWLDGGCREALSAQPLAAELERAATSRADTAFHASDEHGDGFNEYSVALLEELVREQPRGLASYLEQDAQFAARLADNVWVHASPPQAARCWSAGLAHAAEAYRRQGRPAEAAALFERSLKLEPAYAAARSRLLLALRAAGRPDRARALLAGAPELATRYPELPVLLDAPPSAASRRSALKAAFADFEARHWDDGFARLERDMPDFFPARAAELDGWCALRTKECAPWFAAKRELAELRARAFRDFESGAGSAAAAEFARLRTWDPDDRAAAEGLALAQGAAPAQPSSAGLKRLGEAARGLLVGRRPTNEAFDELLWQGEGFIHGARTPFESYRMPLSGIAMGLYYFHAPAALRPALLLLARLSVPLLTAELALLLGASPWAAALAVAAAATAVPMSSAVLTEELFYQAAVLLVAALLAWRAARPTPARGAALGLAVGLSLLVRSPLVFFPVALVLWERLAERRVGGGASGAAALLLIPWVVLLPWIIMNAALLRRFVPLEFHRADKNLAGAVLGLVRAGDFDAPLSGAAGGGGLYRWALAEILRRPAAYAWSFAARLRYAAGLQPLLFGAGLVAVWARRRDAAQRRVGLLAAYYVAAHCLLAVGPRYFEPVWPLAAAMGAAAAAARFAKKREAPAWRPAAAWAVLAALAAVALATLALTAAYPARLARGAAGLDAAVAASPGDPWPLFFRGRAALDEGRPERAEPDLAAAAALRPDYFTFDFARVLALAAQGRARPADLERLAGHYADQPDDRLQRREAALLDVLQLLSGGRVPEARLAYQAGGGRPEEFDAPRLAEDAKAWAPRGRLRLLAGLRGLGLPVDTADFLNLMTGAAREADAAGDAQARAEALAAAADISARLASEAPAPKPAAALAPGGPAEDALDLYTDEELGPLAPRRAELKRSFAAFAARDWAPGFRRLDEAVDGRRRLADLDGFCAQRPRTCAPWLQAQDEIRRLNDDGMRRFLAGDRAGAASVFDAILAWQPQEPSALVNRAVTAQASGDEAAALRLYDEAAGLESVSALYRAEVLTARSALLERRGRPREALADLVLAEKVAPADWPRRGETRRQRLKLASAAR